MEIRYLNFLVRKLPFYNKVRERAVLQNSADGTCKINFTHVRFIGNEDMGWGGDEKIQ